MWSPFVFPFRRYLFPFELNERGISEVPSKDDSEKNDKKEEEKGGSPKSPTETVNHRSLKQKDSDCKGEQKREKLVRRQDTECKVDQRKDRLLKRQDSDLKNEQKKEKSLKRQDSEIADDKEEKVGKPAKPAKQEHHKPEDNHESDVEVENEVKSPEEDVSVDVVNSPESLSDTSESRSETRSDMGIDEVSEYLIGDKVQVKYGRGRNQRMYEAKVGRMRMNSYHG